MKVIFSGDPLELERGEDLSRLSTTIFGKKFPMGVEVDVSDLPEKQQRKLLNNSHFRAVGLDAPPVPLVVPVSALTAKPDPVLAQAETAQEEVAEEPASAKRSKKA